ncbi:MAG: hypothetical protein JHD23_12285 [Akkermansiaceae bacterium]|nr:hypothetical protein [Akkermansiaceae bacterium]MBJ7425254.1 hypothetical protein [Akkermansiaceae bacterium]
MLFPSKIKAQQSSLGNLFAAQQRRHALPFRMPLLPLHLFWDVHAEEIDPEKHAAWLARRVLEYGDWPDWQALVRYYGKDRLAGIVTSIRSLHPRALAFCKVWFDLPTSAFRCSTSPQFP